MNEFDKVIINRVTNGFLLDINDDKIVFEDRPSDDPESFDIQEFNFMNVIFELVSKFHPDLKIKFFK